MRRPLLLALTLGLLATGLSASPTFDSCEECEAYCNKIPMDPTECKQLYCPACVDAGTGTVVGSRPTA